MLFVVYIDCNLTSCQADLVMGAVPEQCIQGSGCCKCTKGWSSVSANSLGLHLSSVAGGYRAGTGDCSMGVCVVIQTVLFAARDKAGRLVGVSQMRHQT